MTADDANRPELRIGDRERSQTADILAAAMADGRLTPDEHAERMDLALNAKTRGDLERLTADLPTPPPDPNAARLARRHERRHELLDSWRSWVSVAVLLTVIWAISGLSGNDGWSAHGYWPIWPLGVWGAVLLVRTILPRDDD